MVINYCKCSQTQRLISVYDKLLDKQIHLQREREATLQLLRHKNVL